MTSFLHTGAECQNFGIMVLRPVKVETRDIVQDSRSGKMIEDSLMNSSPLPASVSDVDLTEACLVCSLVSSSDLERENWHPSYTTLL